MLHTDLDKAIANLDPTDFELLCRSLLHELGFQNLRWRRGGRDRGRDIVSELLIKEPDGTQVIQKWFVECKHHSYSNSISVGDLQTKVAWADAEQPDYLLILTTSYLTPDAKDWVEKIAYMKRYKIRYWEGPHLIELIGQHPLLKQIYLEGRKPFSLENPAAESLKIRLLFEQKVLEEQFPAEGPIVLEEVLGSPPDRFILGMKCQSIVSFNNNDEPVLGKYHRVMISIPSNYPMVLPSVRVLTPVISPHVYDTGVVCYGYCDPLKSLASLAMRVYMILSYEEVFLAHAVNRDPRLVEYLKRRS